MTQSLSSPHVEFFVELLCEEIPARFQDRASDDFKNAFLKSAQTYGVIAHTAHVYMTPRRITLVATVDARIPAHTEERRGPRIGAPEKAIAGFCKGAGIALDQLITREGYYYAHLTTPDQSVGDVLGRVYHDACQAMTWPKVMRWPQSPTPWVRPVRHVCAVLNGAFYAMELPLFNLSSHPYTFGHRFLHPEKITPVSFADYEDKLTQAYVVIDPQKRADMITQQLQKHAMSHHLVWHCDEGLLRENVGLVEYPGVFLGRIDEQLMHTPDVAIITSMRHHQKCFAFYTSDQGGSTLAPFFGAVINTIPQDAGEALSKGYEQGMLKARLEDARYFYNHDVKVPLSDYILKYSSVTFHDKLGSLADKVNRIKRMIEDHYDTLKTLWPDLNRDDLLEAASLSKADVFTHMVGEFDELQGIMGEIYAREQGLCEDVAIALREHYQPLGPDAAVPQSAIGSVLALLDKLDTIFGFIGVGMAPTGSKDPFALRRAALGMIRIVRERAIYLDLKPILTTLRQAYANHHVMLSSMADDDTVDFLVTRLSFALKQEGLRHDIIACALGGANNNLDLAELSKRAVSLSSWWGTQNGRDTVENLKRVSAILNTVTESSCAIQRSHLCEDVERQLYDAVLRIEEELTNISTPDAILRALEHLALPIHTFFESVMVQHHDVMIRMNRIALLRRVYACAYQICDFDKLE